MLFQSIVEQITTKSFADMLSEERAAQLRQIGTAWDYYYGYQEQYIKQYRGEDNDDYADKDKMTFNYTKSVVDVYKKELHLLFTTLRVLSKLKVYSNNFSFRLGKNLSRFVFNLAGVDNSNLKQIQYYS